MTYIVGTISQKGGAGKSTIARLLATELANSNFSVKIADLDTQQTTCTHWAADRAEASVEPEIQVQPFGNIKTALNEAKNFDVYILDGKPHSSEQTLEIAKASDLVIIPTGQTKDDLRPAVQLAHSLIDAGVSLSKITFALMKTTQSNAEIDAAKKYLQKTEYKLLDGYIPISTAYGIAHDEGKAITETQFSSLNKKASQLAQAIIDHLTLITGKKEN